MSCVAMAFFDCDTVRVDQLFGTEFTFDKAKGLEHGDCPNNHAMTLTGVNLDERMVARIVGRW